MWQWDVLDFVPIVGAAKNTIECINSVNDGAYERAKLKGFEATLGTVLDVATICTFGIPLGMAGTLGIPQGIAGTFGIPLGIAGVFKAHLKAAVNAAEKDHIEQNLQSENGCHYFYNSLENKKLPNEVTESKLQQNSNKTKLVEERLNSEHDWILIGTGTFSDVYTALYNNKPVAVKKFRHQITSETDKFKVCFDEAQLLRKLSHQNIISFINCLDLKSKDGKQILLVTELVDGGSMRRFCTGKEKFLLNVQNKISIAVCCWNGLSYLHEKNVCHKDIKPENILVSNDHRTVKIADFGLAEIKTTLSTKTTGLKGTCLYYPPEFATRDGILRHPQLSDVYSMGASLCELFSGQYFWSNGCRPRDDCQIMYILAQQIEKVQNKKSKTKKSKPNKTIKPDCWHWLDTTLRNLLIKAISVCKLQQPKKCEQYKKYLLHIRKDKK